MATALSAYWVRFFKNAGFPQDVATKHAVVFSNNRIKPDMLPDLDKPSLKEMGITLMGDMIAILRYAKRVVEETTCEKFLVDTEDSPPPPPPPTSRTVVKPVVKKVVAKVVPKSTVLSKVKPVAPTKSQLSTTPSTIVKKSMLSKVTKPIVEEKKPVKRKIEKKIEILDSDSDQSDNDNDWKVESQKRLKAVKDDVEYQVIMPKGTTVRSQQILKKAIDQKLTVFDRLGDSSVTSTTNLAESTTTFNITGLGKDVIKRNSSVFNRLGGKDLLKKNETVTASTMKNGSSVKPTAGILKARVPTKTTIVSLNKQSKTIKKPGGTMRADRETHIKAASNSVKQLIKNTKSITVNERSPVTIKKMPVNSKLASERVTSVPAKARLGISGTSPKQVTFNSFASIAHVKKPGVFSRLGL
ncbi:uncharacterized protein C19orf47 homolog isoform X2 [Leptopilina heterotoma]|uniref:uncharacterized protein C19orf47 homolog isoform X2 n=1 Tax=Leptopilina heterotoma TaxID=63436 RepID=UPI001CA9251B|nr:uncharacterized protein C19orf47 homolog isoform X2 [Leptopilina heterotoma]